jgi:hypothetical protein
LAAEIDDLSFHVFKFTHSAVSFLAGNSVRSVTARPQPVAAAPGLDG